MTWTDQMPPSARRKQNGELSHGAVREWRNEATLTGRMSLRRATRSIDFGQTERGRTIEDKESAPLTGRALRSVYEIAMPASPTRGRMVTSGVAARRTSSCLSSLQACCQGSPCEVDEIPHKLASPPADPALLGGLPQGGLRIPGSPARPAQCPTCCTFAATTPAQSTGVV